MVWRDRTVSLHIPVPTVQQDSTDASCVQQALDFVPAVAPFNEQISGIMESAEACAMQADGSDRHSGNLKYQGWKEGPVPFGDQLHTAVEPEVAFGAQECGNHQAAITDNALRDHVGKENICQMRSFCSLCRTGGFLFRMIAALRPVILLGLVVDSISVPPPRSNNDWPRVMRDYDVYHFHYYEAAYPGENKATGKEKQQHRERVHVLVKWCIGYRRVVFS